MKYGANYIMKTKVGKSWYDQEIRAFDWQIKNEIEMIPRTQKRIDNVKNGGVDSAKRDLEYLENLLIKFKSEKGQAQKRKDVFLMTFEPSEKIKPDRKSAELFIRSNAKKTRGSEPGDQFGYYDMLSTVGKLYNLRDRDDNIINWYFSILDDELNNISKNF